jgi:hypothetical protein
MGFLTNLILVVFFLVFLFWVPYFDNKIDMALSQSNAARGQERYPHYFNPDKLLTFSFSSLSVRPRACWPGGFSCCGAAGFRYHMGSTDLPSEFPYLTWDHSSPHSPHSDIANPVLTGNWGRPLSSPWGSW